MLAHQSKQRQKDSRLLRWFLLFMAAIAPAAAQVTWVSSSSVSAPRGIRTSDAPNMVCRAVQGGLSYLGTANDGVCRMVTGNSTMGFQVTETTTYEVGIGLTNWATTAPPGVQAVVGAVQGTVAQRPCRAGGEAGYVQTGESVCRLPQQGQAGAVANYELLYPLDLSQEMLVMTNRALCLQGTLPQGLLAGAYCTGNMSSFQRFRIDPLQSGVYQARVSSNPLAVSGPMCISLGATVGSVGLAACGVPGTRLNIFDDTGNAEFKIRFEANGNFLDSMLIGSVVYPMMQRPEHKSVEQRFTIRTIADEARRMRVISYNIMLLSNTIFPRMRQVDRAKWILQQIMAEDPSYDVIGIQEAFDEGNIGALFLNSGFDALVDAMKDHGYIYRTQRPFGIQAENGGVVVFSRWPIEVRDNNVFDPGHCIGADCLSAKGINYAKINKLGRRYHFFNTHLQAGHNNFHERREQLEEFRPWINGLVGSNTQEPIILTGDFNIDMETQPDNYYEMLRILAADFVNPPRPVGATFPYAPQNFTADPSVNEICRERGCTREWLDYILIGDGGPRPTSASYRVKNYKRSQEFQIDTLANIFNTNDLSDHAALLGDLVFPFAGLVPSQTTFVPIRFEAIDLANPASGAAVGFVRVNGERLRMPVTLDLDTALTYQIELEAPVTTGGERWAFVDWSHTRNSSWELVRPTTAQTYRANFRREFQLITLANPTNGGTISGAGWYRAGVRAEVIAQANANFRFVSMAGPVDGPATSSRNLVTMTGPTTITANFASTQINTRFEAQGANGSAVAPGAAVLVDGVSYPLPVNLSLDPTRTYQIGIVAPTGGTGERWSFASWAHTPNVVWSLVQPATDATYVARFNREFLLTVLSAPAAGGNVTGGGWYTAGTNATIQASANTGYRFVSYTGDISSTTATTVVAMMGPRTVQAQFEVMGMPRLIASPGPRSGGITDRSFTVTLTNTSAHAAVNARIVSVTTQVIEGSGALSGMLRLPLSYGDIAGGGAASRSLVYQWPETARRVRFTIQFQADGGYTGTAVLNLYRN